jgi:hypothetical protein
MTNEDTDIVNLLTIQNNYNLRKVSTNNIWNVFTFPKSVHFVLCEMYCSLSYNLLGPHALRQTLNQGTLC